MIIIFFLLTVVCYEQNRNEMRSQLISWLRPPAGGSEDQNLWRYFHLMDKNKDGTLDSVQFTELMKRNRSISEV